MNRQFEEFCTLIMEIHSEISAIKIQEAGKLGLKGSHVMILYELEKHPEGMTSAKLSAALHLDKAAVSRAISELRSRDYLVILDDNGKKRYRAAVALTEQGLDAARRLDGCIDNAVDAGEVSSFTLEEREKFYVQLRGILSRLRDYRTEIAG